MTADVPAGERQTLYGSRPALFVTTRILVVDLLSGRLSADQAAGMLVLNAHRWVARCVGMGWRVGLGQAAADGLLLLLLSPESDCPLQVLPPCLQP